MQAPFELILDRSSRLAKLDLCLRSPLVYTFLSTDLLQRTFDAYRYNIVYLTGPLNWKSAA